MFCCFGTEDTSFCTFCNIKEAVGDDRIVRETETLIAFHDRSPAAELHLLVIPKAHIKTVNELDEGDIPILKEMVDLGRTLLKERTYNPDDASSIRLGFHVPPFNSVNHLHMHVIGLPFRNKYRHYKYQPTFPWYINADSVLERLIEGMSPV